LVCRQAAGALLRRFGARCAAYAFAIAAIATAILAQAAPVEDTIAQRVKACTGCHGDQGRAAPDGYYPRIAGKPAGYLYNQLLNFREGRRRYALMAGLVAWLTDDYLREIATHFSSLDVPYPPPPPLPVSNEVMARGRALVTTGDVALQVPACVSCHGAALLGVQPAIPGLLGLPRDYINAQLGAWRNGIRHAQAPDCMAEIARRLAPEDISAVSLWLAAQPVPVPSSPAASLPNPLPAKCGGVAEVSATGGPAR
jgi:cytochrome c553